MDMSATTHTSALSNDDVRATDRQYVFHSWSVQGNLNPLVIKSGKGSKLWDFDGKEYLDFSSQLVNTNLGHQHPKLVEAIINQAKELVTVAPSTANATRNEAAKRIVELAPEGFNKVFFTNGGADANENAIRMARLFTGKTKILSSYRSYHGSTGSAIASTGDFRRIPNEYARGHVHFFSPYLYRSEFHATTEAEECERALHHLRSVILHEGPTSIAAVLVESVPGTAGILVPPKDYMKGVRKLCDEFDIMMIFDEVMAGFGRTGKWFALEHHGVTPDLITFAKGVNSGYVPVGGVVLSEKISQYFDTNFFPGGLTYSGHPLAMASIVATIDAMKEENVLDNVERISREVLAPGLKKLSEKHALIGEVRGMGVFWAIELVSSPDTKERASAQVMNDVKRLCTEKGLLTFIADNRIHVVPPCIVTEDEVEEALKIYDAVLTEVGCQ